MTHIPDDEPTREIPDTERPPERKMGFLLPPEGYRGRGGKNALFAHMGGDKLVSAGSSKSKILPAVPRIVQRINDCVGNAIPKAVLRKMLIENEADVVGKTGADLLAQMPSRRQAYYLARLLGNMEKMDIGSRPDLLIEAWNKLGYCRESECPYYPDGQRAAYDESPITDEVARLSDDQRGGVLDYVISEEDASSARWESVVQSIDADVPVAIGSHINGDFRYLSGDTDPWMMTSTDDSIGLHMYEVVGYEDYGRTFIIENQWEDWGDELCRSRMSFQTIEARSVVPFIFAIRWVRSYSDTLKELGL